MPKKRRRGRPRNAIRTHVVGVTLTRPLLAKASKVARAADKPRATWMRERLEALILEAAAQLPD